MPPKAGFFFDKTYTFILIIKFTVYSCDFYNAVAGESFRFWYREVWCRLAATGNFKTKIRILIMFLTFRNQSTCILRFLNKHFIK